MPRILTASIFLSAAQRLLLELENRTAVERLLVEDAKDRLVQLLELPPDSGGSSTSLFLDVSGVSDAVAFEQKVRGHEVFKISVPVDLDKLDDDSYIDSLVDVIGVRTKAVLATWWAGADAVRAND